MSSGGTLAKFATIGLAPDPVSGIMANSIARAAPTNDLVKFALPVQAMSRRINDGEAATPRLWNDPWGAFTKTKVQADTIAAADAFAASAPERAANNATDISNQALIASKRRRQSGLGSLATGATSGGAALSSTATYGKSTLGA
jgi:hypothetical protein